MAKKYELTDETIIVGDKVLHRIKALIDIPKYNVKAGDLGGFIEKEENLSHNGNCWVSNDACVYDNALVYGDAWIYDNARVFGNARIDGNASVCGIARIYDDACVCGYARVYGKALIYGHTNIFRNAWIYGNACISGNACVCGNAYVYGNARVYDKAYICDNARVFGNTCVYDYALVCGGAYITQGKYHVSTMHITVLPYGVTAIYPNHVQIGCKLFEICNKKEAIGTMREFLIPWEYHEQIWIAVRLCKQWLKDNPEKEITNA